MSLPTVTLQLSMPPLGLLQAFLCREVCRIGSHSRRQPGAGHTVTVTSAFRDTELSGRDKPFRSVLLTSLHIWLCWHLPRFLRQPMALLRIIQSPDGLSDEKSRSAFLTDCPLAILGSVWSEVPHAYSRKVKFFQDESSRGLLGSRRTAPISRIRLNDLLSAKRCFAVKLFQCFQSSLEWFSWLQLVLQS